MSTNTMSPLDASFLFHCQAHLDVAMDDHVFQTGASPQRLPGFFPVYSHYYSHNPLGIGKPA